MAVSGPRNRIIAGISSAVVVVEAGEKGGALITARLAAELGRPVFVVPGDIDRPASVGCNRLIRDGAHPVLGVNDLLAEIELTLGKPPNQVPPSEGVIPATGLAIDDLPSIWDCTPARRVGDLVLPGSG